MTSIKTKIIMSVVALLVAFSFGRYSAPTVPDVKTDIKTNTDKQTNTETKKTTTITEDPKGNKVTTINEDTTTQTKKNTDTQLDQTVTAPKKSIINISALAGLDTGRGFIPTYGISANKELIGPITVGAFGLTNGTIGLSIGLNF